MSKENENPQLFSVENADRYAHTERAPLDWTKLGSFVQEPNEGSTTMVVVPTSAEDKAILRALMDASRSTKHGRGVGLLRKAGLSVPTYSSDVVGAGRAGRAKAASSSCYGDSSRPVFRLAEEEDDCDSDNDNDVKAVSVSETEELQDDQRKDSSSSSNDESKISAEEIFDIIRTIEDPEHPNSLEQLGVVSLEQVELSLAKTNEVTIRFTPTIPHCSMATLIGLCLRVKLHRSLPPAKFKVDVSIEPGTHVSEKAINKQLRDKERVRAALENKHLKGVVDKCIRNGMMK
jgi:metal-sulfur cluster biosynthetic enzyme